jgi:transcription elongation factor S-II
MLFKIKDLATDIENCVYTNLFKNEDKGRNYLARAKAIASNLGDKKNPEFRNSVMDGIMTPKEITLMDVKKMASTELQSKRLIAEKESFNSLRSDWNDIHAPVGLGMYTCEKCSGQRTTSKEIQLRGADEPMTL